MTFYSTSIRSSPQFDSPNRVDSLELLEPGTAYRVTSVIAAARAQGIDLAVFETYRSTQRQALLFQSGATQLKDVGTHHFGVACDLVRVEQGAPVWDGDYAFLGRLARVYGLIWGGDWGQPGDANGFVDSFHLQRCTVSRQKALFDGLWYPDAQYNPYTDLLEAQTFTSIESSVP